MFFFAVSIFFQFYLSWCAYRAWRRARWSALFLAFGLLVVAAHIFCLSTLRIFSFKDDVILVSYYWVGFLFMATNVMLFREAGEIAARVIDAVTGMGLRRFFGVRSLRLAMALGVVAYGYSLVEAQSVRVRRVEMTSDRLDPEQSPLRIAYAADTHFNGWTRLRAVEKIVAMINAQEPDVVIFGGDIIDGGLPDYSAFLAALQGIRAPKGKFAVTGNHEVLSGVDWCVDFLDLAGFAVLRGESRETAGIRVVGVDDPLVSDRRGILDMLDGEDDGKFVVLASHRPEVPAGAVGRFDLELSGHTHAGQIWPLSLAMRLRYAFAQGFTRIPATPEAGREESALFLSNGMRFAGPPVRFLAPPDMLVVTVRSGRELP